MILAKTTILPATGLPQNYYIKYEGQCAVAPTQKKILLNAKLPGAYREKGRLHVSQTWLNQGEQCRAPS